MNSSTKSNFKIFVFLLLSSTIFTNCKKGENLEQNDIYDTQSLISKSLGERLIQSVAPTSNAFYIQNALPAGYVKNGSRDYTKYVQQAIDSHSEIVFPEFPLLINDTGLKIGSDKIITFLNGSEIRLKSSSKSSYNMLDIRGVKNVTLINPVIIGDKEHHLNTSGEAGIGIAIRGSQNIVLSNPKVSNCWGDGIYLGVNDGLGCSNISISGGLSTSNRRDGISIVSVNGLKINDFSATYNAGTTPECGINFEPNSPINDLRNIVFNNINTEGNGGYGIMMGFSNLYGGTNKIVDIQINNHTDKQSKKAIKISCYPTRRAGNEIITSNVIYNNPSWRQHPLTNDIISVALFENSQKFTIVNPKIQSASGVYLTKSELTQVISRLFNKLSKSELIFSGDVISVSESVNPEPVVIAINSGGKEYTAEGIKYLADKYFSGGRTFNTPVNIAGTISDKLYQDERYGNFGYKVPIENGIYHVTLQFAETVYNQAGKRKFDVSIEGVKMLTSMDLFSMAGVNNAINITKEVNVTDGFLNMEFDANISYAQLKGFYVRRK